MKNYADELILSQTTEVETTEVVGYLCRRRHKAAFKNSSDALRLRKASVQSVCGMEISVGKQKEIKTNAMRILEGLGIKFTHFTYECSEFVDGKQIADKLSLPYEKVYKTLVTQGSSKSYFVFVIPVAEELDLKKAARAVGEKSVEMIAVKDINKITGYIRGGCTAIGMKKQYVTRIEAAAAVLPSIVVSGGRIGSQIELSPEELRKAASAEYAELIKTTE